MKYNQYLYFQNKPSGQGSGNVRRSFYLMTGLSVQAGGGDVTGPVMAAGGQQDEVTWESLILPHHHDVPHLTE